MSPQRPSVVGSAEPELLQQAADLLEARQKGTDEPAGSWVDRIWLPSEEERRPCCDGLEPDRLKDPQKLRNHCRTLLHVATRFGVDSRLLRVEVRRRREGRGGGAKGRRAAPAPGRRPRRASAGRLSAGVLPSAEARTLHAALERLIADKRAELRDLAGRLGELAGELHRQLQDDGMAVEVALTEIPAAEVAGDLAALVEDLHQLIITRDTLLRVG